MVEPDDALGRREKKKIIARRGGIHGVTIATASLTGLARNHTDFDLPINRILHVDCPHYWRGARGGESEADYATRLATELEDRILAEGPETVAAFIAEPVMGSGGVIVPPATYFDKVQAVLKKYDVLFLVDEVICGFGRLGDMFGCQTFGLKPDMITVAKGLSSGYQPISGLMVSQAIFEACVQQSEKIGVFGHGFTYSGHPVCAAVAVETLKIYEELDIVGHVTEAWRRRCSRVLRRYADHPLVGEVRGLGLVAGLELVRDKATREAFAADLNVGLYIERRCQERGAIRLRSLGDALTVAPPLVTDAATIDELVEIVGGALDDTLSYVRSSGLI